MGEEYDFAISGFHVRDYLTRIDQSLSVNPRFKFHEGLIDHMRGWLRFIGIGFWNQILEIFQPRFDFWIRSSSFVFCSFSSSKFACGVLRATTIFSIHLLSLVIG